MTQSHSRDGRDCATPAAPRRRHPRRIFHEVFERHLQVRHRLIAARWILAEASKNRLLEFREPLELAWRRGLFVDHLREHGQARAAAECLASGHHFIEHRAEAENVRPGVNLATLGLLGRHVRWRADDRSGVGGRKYCFVSADGLRGSRSLAMPKSRTLTTPPCVTMTLDGLRSRWMMPAACAFASASAICDGEPERLFQRKPVWRESRGPLSSRRRAP